MLEYFDKYSESSYKHKNKNCWPLLVQSSKKTIFTTIVKILPEYGYVNFVVNEDYGECFCIYDNCEITITLLSNASNIQINLSVFSNKFGRTYKMLKHTNEILLSIFEGLIIE